MCFIYLLVGDCAQMMELAGAPEMGLLSLQHFRRGGKLERPGSSTNVVSNIDKSSGCGCSLPGCVSSPCTIPFDPSNLNLESGNFWDHRNEKDHDNGDNDVNFPILLRLLELKLMYASPLGSTPLRIATSSVPTLKQNLKQAILNSQSNKTSTVGRILAESHKSHHAYYVLISNLVQGERVKPQRRRSGAVPFYHVPIKDLVNGTDGRFASNIEVSSLVPTSIEADDQACRQHLLDLATWYHSPTHVRIRDTTSTPTSSIRPLTPHPPLVFLGDSHVLSVAWQTIRIPSVDPSSLRPTVTYRTAVPFPTTGLKATHLIQRKRDNDGRRPFPFFTYTNLIETLKRLPSDYRTVIFSAGEIDCREGIGGQRLASFTDNCDDEVTRAVQGYVTGLRRLAMEYGKQILVLPVAPHAYRSEKNGKNLGRRKRRERMVLWNEGLRNSLRKTTDASTDMNDIQASGNVFLLDYERSLRKEDERSPVGFVLKDAFNCDFTHMNSAFLPMLENSLEHCGCDLNLL